MDFAKELNFLIDTAVGEEVDRDEIISELQLKLESLKQEAADAEQPTATTGEGGAAAGE